MRTYYTRARSRNTRVDLEDDRSVGLAGSLCSGSNRCIYTMRETNYDLHVGEQTREVDLHVKQDNPCLLIKSLQYDARECDFKLKLNLHYLHNLVLPRVHQ